jgi:signal transduction histidine kinase
MDESPPFSLAGRQRMVLDTALVLVLAGTSVLVALRDLTAGEHHARVVGILSYVAIGVATLPLPARRMYPRAVLTAVVAGEAVLIALAIRLPAQLAAGFVMYSFVAAGERPLPYRMLAATAAPLAICGLFAWDSEASFAVILASGSILVGWLAGENSRARRSFETALADRAAERERERARRRAVEEKARIARELHDVVAHAMSVITVRSGVARMYGAAQPDKAVEALSIIETISRRALGELRSIVALLRQDGDGGPEEPDPAPGLADVPELVAQIAAAGVRVDVRVEGEVRSLPPTEDLSAYRIAQEALTNVVRHSGADRAVLWIRYLPGTVEIECLDPGGPGGSHPAEHARVNVVHRGGRPDGHVVGRTKPAGHGIAGMRERVAIYGGEFSACPAGLGFRVMARLPVPMADR